VNKIEQNRKRICFIGDAGSTHLIKFAKYFSINYDVHIITLQKSLPITNVSVHNIAEFERNHKIGFLFLIKQRSKIRKLIKQINPDIIHVHYASSYGFLARISNIKYILSVWGSDVIDFPNKSILHKILIKKNLKKASIIFATSDYLKEVTGKLVQGRNIIVTPFGVNTELFKPIPVQKKDGITIGCVKSLLYIYGIDVLIKAFSIVKKKHKDLTLKLLIVGEGSYKSALCLLVDELKISDDVIFQPFTPNENLPAVYSKIDIFANLSRYESFGVSVLEASASEIPVIATGKGGLVETVIDGVTGLLVEVENVEQKAESMERLILDKELRKALGKHGRTHVLENYNIEKSMEKFENIYKKY